MTFNVFLSLCNPLWFSQQTEILTPPFVSGLSGFQGCVTVGIQTKMAELGPTSNAALAETEQSGGSAGKLSIIITTHIPYTSFSRYATRKTQFLAAFTVPAASLPSSSSHTCGPAWFELTLKSCKFYLAKSLMRQQGGRDCVRKSLPNRPSPFHVLAAAYPHIHPRDPHVLLREWHGANTLVTQGCVLTFPGLQL